MTLPKPKLFSKLVQRCLVNFSLNVTTLAISCHRIKFKNYGKPSRQVPGHRLRRTNQKLGSDGVRGDQGASVRWKAWISYLSRTEVRCDNQIMSRLPGDATFNCNALS